MRLPRLFRRRQRLAENSEELEFYLETEAQANMDRGMSRDDAHLAARRKLGNVTLVREEVYQMHSVAVAETILQDLHYAARTMRKTPVFTATIVATLALGIGGNTAAFSVVNGLLLRPLQYLHPDRLVAITADYPRRHIWDTTFSKTEFEKVKAEDQCFAGMGVFLSSTESLTLSGHGEPEALKGARVSGNFLNILGVTPALGRSFLPEEDVRGGPDVAMISNDLWRRRFDGSARVLGQTVALNSAPYTIVGVLPAGFTFPMPGVDVWMTKPSEWSVFPPRVWDIVTSLSGFGRLKPGFTVEQARAEMDLINRRAAAADHGIYVPSIRVTPLSDHVVANIRPTLWTLFGAVGFVLLIACANVASLMLARTNYRMREFAIRTALGAPGGRLIRQLLTESIGLSLLGGCVGLLWARWALRGIAHISVLNLPGVSQVRLDGTVFAFTFGISVVTGILFGLFPSLQVFRKRLFDDLRNSGTTAGRARLRHPITFGLSIRGLLVVAQVAMSIVLLIGAALLLESFMHLQNVNPGFQSAGLLTTKIALAPARYDSKAKKMAFTNELLQRIEVIPGMRSAAMAMSLPTTTWYRTNIQIQGKPWDPNPANWPSVQIQSVTSGYFRTLQIPMERGREFTRFDNSFGSPGAVIINESLARRFWPTYPHGENPIGQHLREGADKTDWLEIVGIAADVHEGSLAMGALPEFYVPWVVHSPQTAYLVARTDRDPRGLTTAVRKQVEAVDPNEAISEAKTMDSVLESNLGQRRLATWVLTSFAAVAFVLAVIGVYGVVAYSVTQRTQEIGIRRALGAQNSDIFRIVLGHAFGLALGGSILGMFGALALTRVIKSLLFGVSASDPLAFVLTTVLFLVVAVSASFLPARRAAVIDPMQALRVG